jgi:hypothetical protein
MPAERDPKTGRFPKGNGAGGTGWGGDKKGAGRNVPFTADDEFRGARTSESIQAKIASREEVLELYTTVLRDPEEATPNKLAAGDKLLDRIEGKPVQKNVNENTSVRRVIRAPAKPADAAEWMQQHSPQPTTKPN